MFVLNRSPPPPPHPAPGGSETNMERQVFFHSYRPCIRSQKCSWSTKTRNCAHCSCLVDQQLPQKDTSFGVTLNWRQGNRYHSLTISEQRRVIRAVGRMLESMVAVKENLRQFTTARHFDSPPNDGGGKNRLKQSAVCLLVAFAV